MFDIRPASANDAAAIAAVHVASWDENYRGILPAVEFEKRTLEQRLRIWSAALGQPDRVTYVYCAERGEVEGFASAVVLSPPQDGFDSYLQTLYLLSRVKAKGVGRALLRAVARALIAQGCKNMSLRVLGKNPARGFYERLGARLVPGGIAYDEGLFAEDVVYAFDDLHVLL